MAENGMTLSVPVSFTTTEWRDEFKRAVGQHNQEFGSNGWGEILLIGDRLVVKEVSTGSELRLRETLEHLVLDAQRTARRETELRNAAREELKLTLLKREHTAKRMQNRFRSF
jgi:hypothetical protein